MQLGVSGPLLYLSKERILANIIIHKSETMGKTRSQMEVNLRKEGLFTLTDEQLDKCKHLEKKGKEKFGSSKNFLNQKAIDEVG